MHWQKESNTNTYIKALAFFLNPTISLFLALFSLKTKSSCVLLFAFFVTFGFSYTVSDVRTEENNLDGISYRNDFENSPGRQRQEHQGFRGGLCLGYMELYKKY